MRALRFTGHLHAKSINARSNAHAHYHLHFELLQSCAWPGRMAASATRKRSVVTLEKKLDVIRMLEDGKSQRSVSSVFNIPKSTIADIWKQRAKITAHVSSSSCPASVKKRCIVREGQFEQLDKVCYTWLMQQRSKGAPISGPLLQEKVLQLFPTVYPHADANSFKASSGWLYRFCCRHGIRELSLQGESLSADTSSVEPFQAELREKIENDSYTLNQIFNADKTGLWWRLMPSKSLVHCGETQAKNFKQSNLLGCANASGTCKLPLAFIHKSAKRRCFKHIDIASLPVHYFSQRKGWMDSKLFERWFQEKFVPHVRRFCQEQGVEYKILLLLDNAPAHPSTETLQSADGKVTTMFLPPNTTSILQPMDQGVLEALKRQYKKNLLHHIILENDASSLSIPDILKQLSIRDAVYWSAQAWDDASPLSLAKSWKKLLPSPHSYVQEVSSHPHTSVSGSSNEPLDEHFESLFHDLGYNEQSWQSPTEWLAEDASDPGYQLMSDEEIVATAMGAHDEEVSEYEEESPVTHADACTAFDTALKYLESQNTDPAHLLLVKKWRDTAARKRIDSLKGDRTSGGAR